MCTITPAANEAGLRDAFLPVRDPHERLALISEACAGPGVPTELRLEVDLVPGCVSQVWLFGVVDDGALHLQWDSASPLVRGLAGMICRVYQDCAPADITVHRCSLLTALGLDRQLSPTRLRGLSSVERQIHQWAARIRAG